MTQVDHGLRQCTLTYKFILVGGLTTRPALVVVTGGIFLTVLVEGTCLGGDGGDGSGGAFWWT